MTVVRHGYVVDLYVRLTIHGRSYAFKVDSGADVTVIDAPVAVALGLPKHGPSVLAHTLGCTIRAQPVQISHWRLGRITLPTIVVGRSKLGTSAEPRIDGLPVAGLLGGDVLGRFGKAALEFRQKRLVLGANAPTSGHAIKITVLHGAKGGYAALVRAEIGSRPIRLLIDTGASLTAIDGHIARQLRLKQLGHAGKVQGASSGCTELVRPVAIQHWTIGDVSLPSAYVVAGRVSAKYPRTLSNPRTLAQGLLGADVLSAYKRVTLEFVPKHLLILSHPRFPVKRAKSAHKS